MEAILLSIKSGSLDNFRRSLSDIKSVNTKYQPHGWTLLHELAALGNETLPSHARMAEELLSAHADV
jgi:hypothetical protein